MPITCVCGIVGALSISSFPLTSGFTTKTLISEASVVEGLAAVYFLLAAASAGVFLHAGIKFPWFVFFQKDSGLRPADAPWNMAAAMMIFSILCIALGVYPEWLYRQLPYPVDYDAYSPGKVLFYLQLLLFSGLAFFLLLPLMKRTRTITLDFDWIWRVFLFRLWSSAVTTGSVLTQKYHQNTQQFFEEIRSWAGQYWGEGGIFNRSWSIGTTALWIAVLLSTYAIIYYI